MYTCKGICINYKSVDVQTFMRYLVGDKWCKPCNQFMVIDGNRCPCCKSLVRNKSRNNKNTVFNRISPSLKLN